MDKLLVKSLLRIVQSAGERFPASKSLTGFVATYNIGWQRGASLQFDADAKARIRELLVADGIDPATRPDAWRGLTRAESLMLGQNEKWTDAPAKRGRVALKALPGHVLQIGGQQLHLPEGCHLDVDGAAMVHSVEHASVLVVENWECFYRIHAVQLDFSRAGDNPLVVWRGDRLDNGTDAAVTFLTALGRPVWAFVDYDPAGLLIASGLPHFAGVLAPEGERLAVLLERGLPDRYRRQLPAAEAVLNGSCHADIDRLWTMIRRAGRALPQEILLTEARNDR